MLKFLRIKNLILIESCEIEFGQGLSVLTGETGAGKTALTQALAFLLGQRADSQVIRKGADKTLVEAQFDLTSLHWIPSLLREHGISFESEEFLLLSREISKEGRSRAWVNSHPVSLSFLQKLGGNLLDIVSQHSSQKLRSQEFLRETLDLFGDLAKDLSLFQLTWSKEKQLSKELDILVETNAKKQREIDHFQFELKELEEADLKEGEEEKLFETYKRLTSSHELSQKLEALKAGLFDSPGSLIPLLNRLKTLADSLQEIDRRFKEPSELLKEGFISLNEAARFFNTISTEEESDIQDLESIDTRLAKIHRLKRKYGKTIPEIHLYQEELKGKLFDLENLEEKIQKSQKLLLSTQKEANQLAKALTEKRRDAALILQEKVTELLLALNMPKALFTIEVKDITRSNSGDDLIEFWLQANPGEPSILVKDSSSGGELCRLLLALHVALAEKNHTPTIVFDEIDSNVGGETASLMADKLKTLGEHRQILCITHFPQVASKADHHLHVFKEEVDGRTLGSIKTLKKKERGKELLRMMGGQKILS